MTSVAGAQREMRDQARAKFFIPNDAVGGQFFKDAMTALSKGKAPLLAGVLVLYDGNADWVH